MGAHRITLGTHNEFFKFFNVFTAGSYGIYNFGSVDSLLAGTPNRYEIFYVPRLARKAPSRTSTSSSTACMRRMPGRRRTA